MMVCHITPVDVVRVTQRRRLCQLRRAQRQAQRSCFNEAFQQVNRGDADDGHRQLDLEHAGVDVAQPFGLIGVAFQAQARDEGFIAAHDHHHQQIGDHHHVDQAQHDQHECPAR